MISSGLLRSHSHKPLVSPGQSTSASVTPQFSQGLPSNLPGLRSRGATTAREASLTLCSRRDLFGKGGRPLPRLSFRPDPRRQSHAGPRLVVCCSKMVVPGFGEKSPEARAADSLHNFFTFLAVKIVLSQLQAYNPDAYSDLRQFADRVSLKDGDKFLAALMRESPQHKGLALRILEVRSVYAREDFEWDNLKQVSHKLMEEANTQLMRDFLVETSKWSDVRE